ncbi:MAG: hypothetical protein LBO69_06140 [Ignavibacteria bacterium]|jgi:hypothetical protein|nr:hypothetical protein [Ignavibacteria bacterium]
MLADVNSLLRGWADYIFSVSDADYYQATSNAYSALCWNKYGNGWLNCPFNIMDVGRVITAYIYYFTSENAPQNAKYYYDEYSDRSDPYRKQLVANISKMASSEKLLDEKFVNDVLSYLYWAEKRGKCAKGILKPLQVEKFKQKDWYLNGIWKSIYKIDAAIIKLFDSVLKTIETAVDTTANVVNGVVGGVAGVLNVTGNAISYLPYILSGLVVSVVGYEAYQINKHGKIKTPMDVKKSIGLGDVNKKKV